jgi:hypothetical protein
VQATPVALCGMRARVYAANVSVPKPRWRRPFGSLAAALLLGAALIGTTPSPAVGCTLGGATLDTALVQGVRFLFVATVVDASADGTYRLRTERVFQGPVPESLTLAPQPGGGINTCDATLDQGVTYVFGMNDFQGAVSLGEVWFQLAQGRVVGSNFITLPTDDARELKAAQQALGRYSRHRHSGDHADASRRRPAD